MPTLLSIPPLLNSINMAFLTLAGRTPYLPPHLSLTIMTTSTQPVPSSVSIPTYSPSQSQFLYHHRAHGTPTPNHLKLSHPHLLHFIIQPKQGESRRTAHSTLSFTAIIARRHAGSHNGALLYLNRVGTCPPLRVGQESASEGWGGSMSSVLLSYAHSTLTPVMLQLGRNGWMYTLIAISSSIRLPSITKDNPPPISSGRGRAINLDLLT